MLGSTTGSGDTPSPDPTTNTDWFQDDDGRWSKLVGPDRIFTLEFWEDEIADWPPLLELRQDVARLARILDAIGNPNTLEGHADYSYRMNLTAVAGRLRRIANAVRDTDRDET